MDGTGSLPQFREVLTSEAEVEAILGKPTSRVLAKVTDRIDGLIRDFIARSPFFLLATAGSGGDCDAFVSFDLEPWDTAAGVALVLACGGAVRQGRTDSGMTVVVAAATEELAAELAAWATEPPTTTTARHWGPSPA